MILSLIRKIILGWTGRSGGGWKSRLEILLKGRNQTSYEHRIDSKRSTSLRDWCIVFGVSGFRTSSVQLILDMVSELYMAGENLLPTNDLRPHAKTLRGCAAGSPGVQKPRITQQVIENGRIESRQDVLDWIARCGRIWKSELTILLDGGKQTSMSSMC